MARALRPRKARPTYASFIDSDNEAVSDGEGHSSNDFQPAEDQENIEDAGLDGSGVVLAQEEDNLPDENDVTPASETPKNQKIRRAKHLGTGKPARSSVALSKSKSGSLDAAFVPPLDHRQRADPLYLHPARVERLSQSPQPFRSPVTTPTLSWNSNKSCAERYMKASGYNIGRGPIWELMEDRSWWKESNSVEQGDTETEAVRRPRVYESVKIENANLEIIDEKEARKFLPAVEDVPGEFLAASIKCSFGKPGKRVMREMKMFDGFEMDDNSAGHKALVFFAGGPVWGLDWCPNHAEDRSSRCYKQYLAVAPLPSKEHSPFIGHKYPTPSAACIQIWSHSPKRPEPISSLKGKENAAETGDDFGQMNCELVLCLDCGPAHTIKWCPLPAHDSWSDSYSFGWRKLGVLAGTFEDGSLSIFIVPDPDDLRFGAEDGPMFAKVKPVIRIELEETCIWSLDWADSERMAVGCTNGFIAVYDLHDALTKDSMRDTEVLPSHYLAIHQSAIRSVQWIPVPSISADGHLNVSQSPAVIASGGYDGCETVTDLRDGWGSVVNRTRDVVLAMTYSRFTEGVITIDLDHSVKTYAMAPGILGRGNIVMECGGPVWSLHTSDYHPFLALGSADGSLLTTNMLRSTRRSATTPFLFHKIFQMDFSRKSGEYRMLDHFLPQESPDRSSTTASKKGNKETAEAASPRTGIQGAGAWSPEVSVTRVAWNNGGGLARAPLLASATASGLCRIDWLLGHFQDERVPYGGIQNIRNEVHTVSNMQDEEDD